MVLLFTRPSTIKKAHHGVPLRHAGDDQRCPKGALEKSPDTKAARAEGFGKNYQPEISPDFLERHRKIREENVANELSGSIFLELGWRRFGFRKWRECLGWHSERS